MNVENKKLLILGATTETINLVKKANSLGVLTYVADPYENAPAKQYAHKSILVDCMDVNKLCNIVKNEQIDGILPGCADVLVPIYEEVCRKTNKTCYINQELVRGLANKKGLKELLKKYDLPTIKEYQINEVDTISNGEYPLFVKPVDNNSSKGMSVINSPQEFEDAYKKALEYSRSQTVLIEKRMKTDDFAVGFIAQNGKIGVTYTADRFVNDEQPGVGTITAGVIYPSKYDALYYETTHTKLCQMLYDLGFRNGILSIQGFVENNKIMFYDPALRISGGQEYILNEYYSNIDMLACLVRFALTGSMSDDDEICKCDSSFGGKIGCNLAFSVKACTIGKIEGMDFARNNVHVINVTQEHKSGDVIDRIGTAQQNFSRMHLVADTKEEMASLITILQSKITAYDESGNNVMLSGMNAQYWLEMNK